MQSIWKYLLGFLALATATIFIAVFSGQDEKLHLIACDVGQGDAILAIYKNNQVLIDGGPDKKVLDCLSRHMSYWDKKIEVVMLTHPQQDHYGGLIDVFKSYEVETFVGNAVDSSSQGYQVLKNLVERSGARVINPNEETTIRLGLIYLDIVSPLKGLLAAETTQNDSDVLGAFTTNRDLNDFSIVAILSLGDFDALLTGDVGPEIIPEIIAAGEIKDIEYIKVPHHGSKNGLTQELLDASMPEVAVISVGKNNSYGHPNEEILKMLSDKNIKIERTDEMGDIEIITDGESWWFR